jgi:hypothetical protein
MSLNNRLVKLEQRQQSSSVLTIAIIIVQKGETDEAAYQRYIANGGIKPKTVVYGASLDMLI